MWLQNNLLKHTVKVIYAAICCMIAVACSEPDGGKEQLGRQLFFDNSLSEPSGQSCATCHRPERGFADTLSRAVSEGAVAGLFSNRNSMSVAYAGYVPRLSYDTVEQLFVGGLFWDGRADSLAHQAGIPFVNPLEMAAHDKAMVVAKVRKAGYFPQIAKIYGQTDDVEALYSYITDALAAYQSSEEVNPFSSKFDAFIAGEVSLSESEALGYEIFKDKGKCAECHIVDNDPRAGRILFTDHTYDNLGVPRNMSNPYYGMSAGHNPDSTAWVDLGLGAVLKREAEYGKFRVPTLRNIDKTAPYGHNGYFKSLKDIVHFYNVRDITAEYPPAEYSATVNKEELGDLKLSAEEELSLVDFMKTLTDGYGK